MKITSIDNCYEDDGLVNLQSTLDALNRQKPDDPTHQRIVAILPEYDGPRLMRLNVLTLPDFPTARLKPAEASLIDASNVIVVSLQRQRAAAMKALDDAPLPSVVFPDK